MLPANLGGFAVNALKNISLKKNRFENYNNKSENHEL